MTARARQALDRLGLTAEDYQRALELAEPYRVAQSYQAYLRTYLLKASSRKRQRQPGDSAIVRTTVLGN